MHCPMCGHELRTLDRTEDLRAEEYLFQQANDAWMEGGFEGPPPDQNQDRSEHLACHNVSCDLRGTYWNLHHPSSGLHSEPGDSFALTTTREGRDDGGAYTGQGDIYVSIKKITHCIWCGNLVRQNQGLCLFWTKKATATCNHCNLQIFNLSQEGDAVTVAWIK